MMESFYLTDTKPLPFVCHPQFAHSSVINYMVFTNAICQQIHMELSSIWFETDFAQIRCNR